DLAGPGSDIAAHSLAESAALAVGAACFADCPSPARSTIDAAADPKASEALTGWIERGRGTAARAEALLRTYRPELLDADLLVLLDELRQAQQRPPIVRWFFAGRARKRVRPYALAAPGTVEALITDLEEALAILAERRELARPDSKAARGFGPLWKGIDSEWDTLESHLRWSERFQNALRPLRASEPGRRCIEAMAHAAGGGVPAPLAESAAGAAAAALAQASIAWDAAWEGATSVLEADPVAAWGAPEEAGWHGRARDALDRWGHHLQSLNDWCAWRRERAAACACGLAALVEAYESGSISRPDLSSVFERSFGERWLVQAADASVAIREFNARAHGSAIERFRQLDSEVIRLTRRVVAGRLAERVPGVGVSVSASSEVGILRRELEKRARHMPTRRLIESLPNLLPRLKPCFLMSPLSVAQYLDADHPPFDLVVFDEASQIPVWDAIGSIARGAEAIIVGDSKQLPPTNFFSTVEADDDEGLLAPVDDELESILQECNASGVPALRLKWHYRSRHESLITFSNHHYYDDQLHTFPSPVEHSPELGVSFRMVEDAAYDRGGTRTNRVEAEAVVAEVVRRLREPGATGSVGVVTFNQPQQGLIEDLFDQARREHPEIEPFFVGVEEPVFVKNLENVQGDERDTIIFSVGYGPDEAGRTSMNFGPLNAEGGERRLNVAVTRARYRLLVFCSMQPEAIDLSRTRATGVHHFKRFLMYAQRGPGAIAEAAAAHAEAGSPSDLERTVCAALESRGWSVRPRVGLGGYRVDLAIDDPERAGEYLLGIECDGPMYRRASTARDRDRTRFSVMGGLGWRLVRVWSTAWRLDPDGCIAQIEDAIAQAVAERERADDRTANPPKLSTGAAGVDGPAAAESPVSGNEPPAAAGPGAGAAGSADMPDEYRAATRVRGVTSRSDIFHERTNELAVRALAAIVSQEAPIVPELALRRLAEWFGVSRITDRYRERFKEILGRAASAGMLFARGDAFWPAGANPVGYDRVRPAGDSEDSQRDIEWIPLIERVAAVKRTLAAQIALPREELEREAARLLGISRVTAKSREAMGEAIDEVIERGAAHEADDRVVVS
ncbi:MAG: AAA domain-containing protein, partial [Phycisphaerales bacterium JB041]